MAFPHHSGGGGPSSVPMPMPFQQGRSHPSPQPSSSSAAHGRGPIPDFHHPHASPMFGLQDNQFDIFEWYPQFQSCLRYFLDHAQYSGPVQAVAAFVNIQLPCQKSNHPIPSSRSSGGSQSGVASPTVRPGGALPTTGPSSSIVTLTPYIRRLVATGFDFPGVLHGFFGDDWVAGVGRLHEVERRNYLFAAKSACWLDVKRAYDDGDGQSIPFLRPLQHATEEELVSAETHWSEWLSMQDWLIGPRSIDNLDANSERDHMGGYKGEAQEDGRSRYHDIR
ncbi:hypothetical protein BKA67DRAFT_381998 [Truncatella angustata]|uniref:Ilp is an apoptosis inhibitor n=1 Tax=Truncatella angustata TaxID=152316 RepID=A0A9P8UFM9_9PEZI|nr:uncharacterized protein BKA67DRAFT_381998 [Truncatella angustata]KAH6649138.1 hypothetical protein BKA67DRAFT_381998 [Truncatella angustata]KAH8197356.1 hypothetical protein TruAng_008486 [Truncatella angustata]